MSDHIAQIAPGCDPGGRDRKDEKMKTTRKPDRVPQYERSYQPRLSIVRLRRVRHRYPFCQDSLLSGSSLLLTCAGCVEREDSSFIPLLHDGRLNLGSCPETPDFPSKIRLPSITNTCAQVITGLSRLSKAIPLQQYVR